MTRRILALAALLVLPAAGRTWAAAGEAKESSCVACHAQLDGKLAAPTKAWQADVHAAAGIGCAGCHGGDPSSALASDAEAAMAQAKGFRKAPDRLHVPGFCGECHANAEFMKRFNPQARVDQLAEYRTSVHGKLNAKGDPVPATCIDCHGAHGVRPISSPNSPVFAANVPATCARCHANADLMVPYGIPTSQYDDYRRSVHAAALLERGDTAAPACNDCHGNHGAAPPGVASVANVCGQCHGREATLFRASFKKNLFDGMQVGECTVCHDHHLVRHPTPSLFHGASAPRVSQGEIEASDPLSAVLGELDAGKTASVSWQVVLRPHVPGDTERLLHRVEISAEGVTPVTLDATVRPGQTPPSDGVAVARTDALAATLRVTSPSGLPVEPGDALALDLEIQAGRLGTLHGVRVRDQLGNGLDPVLGSACLKCHTQGDKCDVVTEKMHAELVSLDRDLRHSSALLREAEIKGMEVGPARFELKSKGTTAAVEARALIHSFDPDRLVQRSQEGKTIAAATLEAARAALAELQFRRKGLAVSLVLVGVVLLALYLKIRQIDRERTAAQASERSSSA